MLQSLTYTWALNQARPHRPVKTIIPPPLNKMSSSSAREAQVGERGGDVEVGGEGEGGEQPLAPPSLLTLLQKPSVLLIVSRTHLLLSMSKTQSVQ